MTVHNPGSIENVQSGVIGFKLLGIHVDAYLLLIGDGVVVIQHTFDMRSSPFGAKAQTGVNNPNGVRSHPPTVLREDIQRLLQLHVGVQIVTAVVIDHPQSGHIGYKGVLFLLVGLSGEIAQVDIEIAFVPFNDLVIGTMFFPGINAL